jgi:PAS domain S-box-containing protein
MHEVSSRVWSFFEEATRELGLDPKALLANTRLTLAELRNPKNRVDWDDWAAVCDRFEELAGGTEAMATLGRRTVDSRVVTAIRNLTAHVLEPGQVYDAIVRWYGPFLFRSHTWRSERLSRDSLRITLELLPTYRGSAAWFRLCIGMFETAPRFIGLPDARVSAEIGTHRGVYEVHLPQKLPLRRRVGRTLRRLFAANDALEELAELQEELAASQRMITESQHELRTTLDRMPDAVVVLEENRIVFGNQTWTDYVGAPAADARGRSLVDFFDPEDRGALLGLLRRDPPPVAAMVRLRMPRPDAGPRIVEAPRLVDIQFAGRPARLFVARDVTERAAAETALQRSEATKRALIEALPNVILHVTATGRILAAYAGRGVEFAIPLDVLLGKSGEELIGAAPQIRAEDVSRGQEAMRATMADGRSRRVDFDTRVNGEARAYECEMVRLENDEALVIVRDVTDRRKIAAQLAMTDRLASLGTLAAGIAHEINNPLTYVLASLDEIRRNVGATGGAAANLPLLAQAAEEAYSGAERVQRIVRDLKVFARGSDDDRESPVDVTRVLDAMVNIVSNEIRHRARLTRDYREVLPVLAVESRLGQVFLNLLVNATQALPEGRADENEIRVTARMHGDFVVVSVEDTGAGIPAEIRGRIFDPFFTTKANSTGTGLGLAICQDIVHRHGGRIEVDSEVGAGSRFRVFLRSAPTLERRDPRVPASARRDTPRRRILIVDDEPSVARALARLVRRHDVTIVTDGADALALMARDRRWDVVFCDLMMPVMSGAELFEKIREEHPELTPRVVLMTGGAFTEQARALLARVSSPVVEKPFDPRVVATVIDQVAMAPEGPLALGSAPR